MVATRPVHCTAGLTGRRRHRVKLRIFREPLLILEVEETVVVYRRMPPPRARPGEDEIDRYTVWRDATPEDLMNQQEGR